MEFEVCTARLYFHSRNRPAVSGMSRRIQALFALKRLCWVTKIWYVVTTTTATTQMHYNNYYCYYHRRKLGGGGNATVLCFFYVGSVCFGYWVEGWQINLGESGRKEVCVRYELVQTNLPPLFLTWLRRKLKFQIPRVNYAPSANCY